MVTNTQPLTAEEIEDLRIKLNTKDDNGNVWIDEFVTPDELLRLLSMLTPPAVKHNQHCGCPSCCQQPADAEVREVCERLENASGSGNYKIRRGVGYSELGVHPDDLRTLLSHVRELREQLAHANTEGAKAVVAGRGWRMKAEAAEKRNAALTAEVGRLREELDKVYARNKDFMRGLVPADEDFEDEYAECKGCAYDKFSVVTAANCVGCSEVEGRPHYVPDGPFAPENWWDFKKEDSDE